MQNVIQIQCWQGFFHLKQNVLRESTGAFALTVKAAIRMVSEVRRPVGSAKGRAVLVSRAISRILRATRAIRLPVE